MKRRIDGIPKASSSKKSRSELIKIENDEDKILPNNIETSSKQNEDKHLSSLWEIPEVLADSFRVPLPVCKKFTSLILEDCTLPFIARYRKEAVGDLDIEVLRKMKSSMEDLQKVQGRIVSVINTLEKQNVLTPSLNETICNIKDLDELEFCYAPFKDTKKRTLAARAKELGLEEPALKLLHEGSNHISLGQLVNAEIDGLESIKSVELGVQHVIADVIGKNKENNDKMSDLLAKAEVQLRVSKSRSASKQNPEDLSKFESYIDKTFTATGPHNPIKSHVFLAISRGEDLKVLSVKYIFPNHVETNWVDYCVKKYSIPNRDSAGNFRKKILLESIKDAFSRIVEPLFMRRIKSKLTEKAHHASVDVFARNLKSLLLSPPLPNTIVLGLDPGFKHGCKCAAVSPNGSVLHTETIYIRFGEKDVARQAAAASLKNMVQKYGCSTIGLGNGKACRETENFLSNLIQQGHFKPHDVKFTIVNESGASIYSCSPEAKEEFPELEPNLISAISIARRLQDPLTEYVRISPQNIGIGMYQHDISVKQLETALDDVVSECVSFVGVDLNSCPQHVLSKVAGLTSSRAKKIIEYRNKNGAFINRQQILDVPSIGPKTFQQCAGFLTIPELSTTHSSDQSALCKTKDGSKSLRGKKSTCHTVNPLDRTCVHPESYALAQRIIDMFEGDLEQIGHESFIRKLKAFLSKKTREKIADDLGETKGKIDQILLSLSLPLRYDLRTTFEKPVFKRNITSMTDIKVGQELKGRINNVTDFGAFVDIGVGKDALLHISCMKGQKESLSVTKQISVRVISVNAALQRVSLELIN